MRRERRRADPAEIDMVFGSADARSVPAPVPSTDRPVWKGRWFR
jgi:hypothetical protein